jgi:hypothetical protein
VSLRLTTDSKIVELEELNAKLGLVKEANQRQRGVVTLFMLVLSDGL